MEQRTEPCGALRMWTSALRSGPGEVPYYSAMFTDLDSLLLQTSKAQMTPKTLHNCFLGSMSAMRYGHTSTSCILGNFCSCAHCCIAANGRDGHTGLVYLVYQTNTDHTFCVDAILLCEGTELLYRCLRKSIAAEPSIHYSNTRPCVTLTSRRRVQKI